MVDTTVVDKVVDTVVAKVVDMAVDKEAMEAVNLAVVSFFSLQSFIIFP